MIAPVLLNLLSEMRPSARLLPRGRFGPVRVAVFCIGAFSSRKRSFSHASRASFSKAMLFLEARG